MENPRFNIPSALALLYGIANPVAFPGVAAQQEREAPGVSFSGIEVVPDETVRPMSHLGTPIFYPFTLKGGVYKGYDSKGVVTQEQLGDLRLPLSTVVEMARAKSITETPVSANGGSVKEVFTYGDWDIRVSGIMMDEPKHPQGADTLETMEQRLLEFDHVAASIGVDADLFGRRGIDRLVIKSISFNQIPGKPRMCGYQMQCTSDVALELLIQ
jgi:hypothetical protein